MAPWAEKKHCETLEFGHWRVELEGTSKGWQAALIAPYQSGIYSGFGIEIAAGPIEHARAEALKWTIGLFKQSLAALLQAQESP